MAEMDYSQYYPREVKKWVPNTSFAKNSIVILPTAEVGVAMSDILSGQTFDATEYVKWAKAASTSNDLTVGCSTMRRREVSSSAAPTTNQTLRLTFFTANKSFTATQVRTETGGTAAGATPTLCRIGLYKVEANGDLTLIASTPNDTTLWAAATTVYTKAFSASVDIVFGQRYALGILVVTAATAPTFTGSNVINATECGTDPRISATQSGQADLGNSYTNASLGNNSAHIYSVVLP